MLLTLKEFNWALLGFAGFEWILPGFAGFELTRIELTGFLPGFHWVLVALSGLDWVEVGAFDEVGQRRGKVGCWERRQAIDAWRRTLTSFYALGRL